MRLPLSRAGRRPRAGGAPSDAPPAPAGDPCAVPMHPEALPDPGVVRWVVPYDTLPFAGRAGLVPGPLGARLARGEVAVEVGPGSVLVGLTPPLTWRTDGPAIRAELAEALAEPGGWAPRDAGTALPPGDALAAELARRAQEAVDGAPGDYIRSHGGQVRLVGVHGGEVRLELSGACGHCPASSFTLSTHFENELRKVAPGMVRVRSVRHRG